MLSRHDILINTALMLGFLGFWAIFVSGFILPFTTISPMLLDFVGITGLPIEGKEAPALFSLLVKDMGIQFSKSSASYSAFLIANAKSKGLILDGKHHTFLLY